MKQTFLEPKSAAERELARIWAEVLAVSPVGVHDNFFELGGDSIRMIQVLAQAEAIGLSLTTEQLFGTPTIATLAREGLRSVSGRNKVKAFELISDEDKKLLPDDIEDAYPLATLQAGMHYHVEMNPLSGIFHDVFSYRVGFPLQAQMLEQALQQVTERHEILRTAFVFTPYSEPIQLVCQIVSVDLGIEDLSDLTPELQHKTVLAWIEKEKRRTFDFAKAPLLRFHAQQLSEKEFTFIVSFYHALFDGWSLAVLVSEVLLDYVNACRGKQSTIEAPKAGYREFIAQERKEVASPEGRRFWTEKLQGPTRQRLPRWPKSYLQGGNDQIEGPEIRIERRVFAGLKQLAGNAGVPLRTVLLAAHFRMLQFVTNQEAVVSGVVMNGRPEEQDGERILGLFLNVVPMKMDLTGGTWLELVNLTYQAERTLLPFRRYPLSEIQKLGGAGSPFDAAFNYVNWHVFRQLKEELGIEFSEGPYFEANNFTLLANVSLDVFGAGLSFHFDYDPNVLAESQIQALGNYYVATLESMASIPEALYEASNTLPEGERQKLLTTWNDTASDYPRNQCIHELFEERAKDNPDAVALVFRDEKWTYGELNRRADLLAGHLRRRGVQADVLVGIFMERSMDVVTAMLGILKAGGAYVPLDVNYPLQRLKWMVEDSGINILLSNRELSAADPFKTLEVINLLDWNSLELLSEAKTQASANNLAYVLYTSGSTGIPKGVAIPHRGGGQAVMRNRVRFPRR